MSKVMEKYNDNYGPLSSYIRWRDCDNVVTLLKKDKTIDVTYDDGTFFKLAVMKNSDDNDKPDIVKANIVSALLRHFEDVQLQPYKDLDKDDDKYKEKLLMEQKMRAILAVAIEDEHIPEEMKQALSPYISFKDEDEQSLPDLDADFNHADTDVEHLNHSSSSETSDDFRLTEDRLREHDKADTEANAHDTVILGKDTIEPHE